MATCYRHPNRETGVSCSNCGNPICPDCMTPTPVGMRCPDCANQKTQVRTIRSTTTDPIATYVLIAINVLAFLGTGDFGVGDDNHSRAFIDGALLGQGFSSTDGLIGVAHGEWYRLITGGFMHSGILHIAFNMYLLYVLGQLLEPALGTPRFLAIYFVSLLGGSFGALLLEPDTLTVGASGAVFGLMAAGVIVLHDRGIDPMQSGLLPTIVLNLAITFLIPGISIGGHIGGLVAGALAGVAVTQLGRRSASLIAPLVACALVAAAAVAGSLAVADRVPS